MDWNLMLTIDWVKVDPLSKGSERAPLMFSPSFGGEGEPTS